jgi:hypothetical protein
MVTVGSGAPTVPMTLSPNSERFGTERDAGMMRQGIGNGKHIVKRMNQRIRDFA